MARAHYYDGRSTRIREVTLAVIGDDLAVTGGDVDFHIPFRHVEVDERLGSAPRRLRFPDGAFCEVRDLDALDLLLSAAAHRDGWVDRLQRRWPFVLFSIAAFIAVMAASYLWILPWTVEIAARRIPPSVDAALTTQTMKILDGNLLQPSKLPEARQRELTAAFRALRLPDGGVLHSKLLFRNSPQLRANAFTLPDGTIILLDDLVTALGDDKEVLAVLGHELGHAHARHSLQMLLRSSVVAGFWTFYVGDISNLIAAVPAAMIQARYSQAFEREADDYGAQVLMLNGLSPALLADALEKLKAAYPETSGGGYLASHPPTDERMERLRDRAARAGKI